MRRLRDLIERTSGGTVTGPHLVWFDAWAGAYLDTASGVLYVAPLPFVVLTVQLWDAA